MTTQGRILHVSLFGGGQERSVRNYTAATVEKISINEAVLATQFARASRVDNLLRDNLDVILWTSRG